MLTLKFIVLRSFPNIARPVLHIRHLRKNVLRNQESSTPEIIKDTQETKCVEKAEISDQKCEPNQSGFNLTKFFSRRTPKTLIKKDVFKEALHLVEKRAGELTKSVDDELLSIERLLKKHIKAVKSSEKSRFRELCQVTECKLRILLALDGPCGTQKRKLVLSFNEQVRQAFEKLQTDLEPSIDQTRAKLDKLHHDTEICVKRATDFVHSCEKRKSLKEVQKCSQQNAIIALKALEQTRNDARFALDDIKRNYTLIMENHKKATEEVVNTYREKAVALSKYLDQCIKGLKKS